MAAAVLMVGCPQATAHVVTTRDRYRQCPQQPPPTLPLSISTGHTRSLSSGRADDHGEVASRRRVVD